MVDRLYTPQQVCSLIGIAHVSDVYRLIKDGEIRAKRRVVRGKGKRPRLVVPESAIKEYVRSLPDNEARPEPSPTPAEGKPCRRSPATPSSLKRKIEESTRYA